VDDHAAERDLVVDPAGGGRCAADDIDDVVLSSMLDHVRAVRGAGTRPVLVERQLRRLALGVQEELVRPAYLQVEGDGVGAARGGTRLSDELVLEAEAAREGSVPARAAPGKAATTAPAISVSASRHVSLQSRCAGSPLPSKPDAGQEVAEGGPVGRLRPRRVWDANTNAVPWRTVTATSTRKPLRLCRSAQINSKLGLGIRFLSARRWPGCPCSCLRPGGPGRAVLCRSWCPM
jgi:hypothetical protein